MKKIILSILAIVVLVIALTVFLVIRSFNAENYKEQVIQTLQDMTGRTVVVNGEVSLSWKPLPTFVMNDLSISNAPTSKNATMATINQVQVEIEWTSFLKSPLVIKRIILKKPEILVERQHSYQTNFFFPVLFNPNRTNDQESLFSSSFSEVSIDTLKIEEGVLKWENTLNGEKFTLHNISGTGQIKSLDGPYSFEGNYEILGQKFDLTLQTDKLLAASPLQISVDAKNSDSQTVLKAAAIFDFAEDENKWLSISGSYASQNPRPFFEKLGLKNWQLEGNVSGSYKIDVLPKQTQFKDIIFSQKSGDKTILSAKLNLEKKAQDKMSMSLMVDTIDLTHFNQALLDLLPQEQADLDIQVSNAVWHQVVLQPLSFKGNTQQGNLTFQLSASLPQEGAISLKGDYQRAQKKLTGDFSCTLSDALAWAFDVLDKKYLPQSNAKKLTLMGRINANPQQQVIDIQLGSLDNFEMTGKISHTSDQWQTDLNVKNLNLDDYYTLPDDYLVRLYHLIMDVSDTPLFVFHTPSVWNLEFSNFTLNRFMFPLVHLKGKLENDKITLTDILFKESDENQFSLSGIIDKPARADISFDTLTGRLITRDLSKWFIGGLKSSWLQDNVQDINAALTYTGNLQQGVLQTSVSSSGREVTTNGKVENLWKEPTFYQNQVHLSYPNLTHFIQLFSPDFDLDLIPLSLDFLGQMTWAQGKLLCDEATLKLGKDTWNFSAQYDAETVSLKTDVKADNINLTLLTDVFKTYWQQPLTPLNIHPSPKLSVDMKVQSDRMQLNNMSFKNFITQILLENQKMDVKELSFSSEKENGLLSLNAFIDFGEMLFVDGDIKMENMTMPENVFEWEKHQLGQGKISLHTAFGLKGNNVQSLINSMDIQTPFSWNGAILTGANLGNLKNSTMNTLQMLEIPKDFNERLNNDFQSGHTPLPSFQGNLIIQQGQISLNNIQGTNDLLDVSGMKIEKMNLDQSGQMEIPFVLKMSHNLPAVILKLSSQGSFVDGANFIGGLTDVIKILSSQKMELKQQKMQQEKEQKNAQMQQSAEQILSQTETVLKILQEKIGLNPSEQATQKMTQLTQLVQEIRHLAVQPNLSDSEYVSLLGKTKMLSAQAKDFNNWFDVSDLVNRQKETVAKREKAETLLNQMEKIYQQNSRSVLMAELIINARSVLKTIQQETEKLKQSKDKTELIRLMNSVDANELKLQKAYDYMKKNTFTESR